MGGNELLVASVWRLPISAGRAKRRAGMVLVVLLICASLLHVCVRVAEENECVCVCVVISLLTGPVCKQVVYVVGVEKKRLPEPQGADPVLVALFRCVTDSLHI
jgi:hypothetical protein